MVQRQEEEKPVTSQIRGMKDNEDKTERKRDFGLM